MQWENDRMTAQTLVQDLTGMTCVSDSPISKISATVEYLYLSGFRRITIEVEGSSLSSGWMGYDTHLLLSELEAQTHTALELWQERHIKRALSGYKPWAKPRLMRALLAELVAARSNSTPWKRSFR